MLDNLAMAWSQLDRARPPREAGVPALLHALDEWVRWAVRVDDGLLVAVGGRYAAARTELEGGRTIPAIRHAFDLTDRHGHPIEALVTVSAGSPTIFFDVWWRPYEELPPPAAEEPAADSFRRHLAGQAARVRASELTTFLLTAAVDDDRLPDRALSGPRPVL
jgi:hypothetical protein